MTLFWIGSLIVLLVVLPVVVSAARRADEARSIVPERATASPPRPRAGSKDLDAVPLLLTTQEQVKTDGRGRRRTTAARST